MLTGVFSAWIFRLHIITKRLRFFVGWNKLRAVP
ncbi:MAG: hypothetical protein ACI93T_003032, partial [Porticoccaceae bacterium]